MKKIRLLCGLMFALGCILPLRAAENTPPRVGLVEKLGQRLAPDVQFYDESGHLIPLKSIINKPTIVTFVYFRCPGICTPLLNELAKIVDKSDLVLGKDYQIVSISFDPSDTPEMAAEKRLNYLHSIKKQVDPGGWRFLTGDSASIRQATDQAGFYYLPNGNDFTHPTALIVLTPDGVISRYINGYQYLPFDIKMAVYEASQGKTAPTIARVLNFCFSYNPEGHTYTLNFMRIALVGILGMVALFVYFFIVRPRNKAIRKAAGT